MDFGCEFLFECKYYIHIFSTSNKSIRFLYYDFNTKEDCLFYSDSTTNEEVFEESEQAVFYY